MLINTISDFRTAVRQRKYTSVGCYPLFFLMADGECLCPSCAKTERRQILEAMADRSYRDFSWLPVAIDINYEDGDMQCAHCNERIESAYAEPEETAA